MEKLSPLAKDLLFEMVYHGTLKYTDLSEEQKKEYEEWKDKHYQNDESCN